MTSKALRVLLTLALLLALPIPEAVAAGSPEILVSAGAPVRDLYNSVPLVTVFPDGGFVVVWTGTNLRSRRAGIYARFFTAEGQPASRAFRLVERTGRSQFADQVEADRDGSFLLVWDEEKVAGGGKRDVFVRRFDRRGTPLGEPIRVHAASEFDRSLPVLAVAPDGRFAVAWSALFDPRGTPTSVADTRLRVFSRRGQPLTGEIVAAGVPEGENLIYTFPDGLAWNADGSLTLLYGVNTYPLGIDNWLVRVPLHGGEPLAPVRLTRAPVSVEGDFGRSLAVAADGSIFVAWGEDVLQARRFAPDLTPLGGPWVVSAAPTAETLPEILALADGSFLVVWNDRGGRDGDGDGVFARRFALDGAPLTRTLRVNRTTRGNQNWGFPAVGRRGPVWVAWAVEDAAQERSQIVLRPMPFGN